MVEAGLPVLPFQPTSDCVGWTAQTTAPVLEEQLLAIFA